MDFQLILSNPSGGVSLATTAMTFRIEDDDSGEASNPLPPASPPGSSGGSGAIDWASVLVLALLALASRSVAKRQFRKSFLAGIGVGIVDARPPTLARQKAPMLVARYDRAIELNSADKTGRSSRQLYRRDTSAFRDENQAENTSAWRP